MHKIKPFKIRCSAIGKIMGGQMGLSPKQDERLEALTTRHTSGTAKPLTAKMVEEMNKLQQIKDNPVLPTGAKSYVKLWYQNQIYGRRKIVITKETAKGIYNEDDSIKMLSKFDNTIYLKNEKHYENQWMTGTPDIITRPKVKDVKNSFDHTTFPILEQECPNPDYVWQIQGYMALTGRQHGEVVYLLTNTPEHLIDQAANREKYLMDMPDVTEELWEKHAAAMTFDDIPVELRIKRFRIDRDEQMIEAIETRVEHCRAYLETIKIK